MISPSLVFKTKMFIFNLGSWYHMIFYLIFKIYIRSGVFNLSLIIRLVRFFMSFAIAVHWDNIYTLQWFFPFTTEKIEINYIGNFLIVKTLSVAHLCQAKKTFKFTSWNATKYNTLIIQYIFGLFILLFCSVFIIVTINWEFWTTLVDKYFSFK